MITKKIRSEFNYDGSKILSVEYWFPTRQDEKTENSIVLRMERDTVSLYVKSYECRNQLITSCATFEEIVEAIDEMKAHIQLAHKDYLDEVSRNEPPRRR